MSVQTRLAKNLREESEAYGYTLSVWGGGAILMNRFGDPTLLHIFLFIGGALAGFALLGLVAYDDLFAPADPPDEQRLVVASTIHIFATFGNLLVSYVLATAISVSELPATVGFLVVGVHVTVTYNLGLLAEAWSVRVFSQFDQWHEEGSEEEAEAD